MSRFDGVFVAGVVPGLMWTSGQAAVYHPSSGDDVDVTGVLTNEAVDDELEDMGRDQNRSREFTIETDPDSDNGGVADPKPGADKVTVDSRQYLVAGIANRSDSLVTLRLLRTASIERSRPDWRS